MSKPMKRFCTYCQSDKVWHESGLRLKDGSRIYLDHDGLRWSGKRCPDCERSRVRAALKQDAFEKSIIQNQLTELGYSLISSSYPMRVQKDGLEQTVGIQYATIHGKDVKLGKKIFPKADIFALVFQSVRICTKVQLVEIQTAAITQGSYSEN